MRDYPTHCKEIVYPIFTSLMSIKESDKIESVKSLVLFTTITSYNYIGDPDADMFGLGLKQSIKDFYSEVSHRKPKRKKIDILLCNIIIACGEMLRANNLEFPDHYINNNAGRIRDHYSYKVINKD